MTSAAVSSSFLPSTLFCFGVLGCFEMVSLQAFMYYVIMIVLGKGKAEAQNHLVDQ